MDNSQSDTTLNQLNIITIEPKGSTGGSFYMQREGWYSCNVTIYRSILGSIRIWTNC
jgi:hypothetical protein